MAPNDLEQLSVLFAGVGEDVVHDLWMNYNGDYQQAYKKLLEMCPQGSGSTSRESDHNNENDVCRFVCFETHQTRNPNDHSVQLSRIVLFADGRSLEVKRVSNPGGRNPPGEGPNNIKDQGFDTKWLDFNKQPIIMELAVDFITPDSYILVTANDFPSRDPVRWVVRVSTDGQTWSLLDDRSRSTQEITCSRMEATPPFGVRRATPLPSLTWSTPMPLSDREQIAEWTRTSRQLPREFRQAASSICFVPELMGTSRLDHKLALLEARQSEHTTDETIEVTATHIISRAFNVPSERARSYTGSVPGNPFIRGNFFKSCVNVYTALEPWQKPLFHTALGQMCFQDSDSLKIMLGLLLQASGECMARKQHAFTVAIDRSIEHHTEPRTHESGENTLEYHKRVLLDAAQSPMDELKSMAFKSVFLEPTKMYFRAVGDAVMEGDVEVHGSNTYLALLLAALGVKLAHSPMLSDDVKGVARFQDALNTAEVNQLWDPLNRGKNWETTVGRRHPTVQRRVTRNQFFFQGATARTLARNCLENSSGRRRFRPYVEAFARHFSPEVAVEWLCN